MVIKNLETQVQIKKKKTGHRWLVEKATLVIKL